MKRIMFYLLLVFLTYTYGCAKDDMETPKTCMVTFQVDGLDCKEVSSSCSQITISVTQSIPAFGWTLAFEYSGCGETGRVTIERANNGCIESINQSCN